MTSTGGITQGLPPLPKSLNSLWSMGRESLSKAEATLGLRSANTAAAPSGKTIQSNQCLRIVFSYFLCVGTSNISIYNPFLIS